MKSHIDRTSHVTNMVASTFLNECDLYLAKQLCRRLMEEENYCLHEEEQGSIVSLPVAALVLYRDLERREFYDINFMHKAFQLVREKFQIKFRSLPTRKQSLKSRLRESINVGKHLLSGALSAAICKTTVAPIERVRMDILLNNTSQGPLGASVHILNTEGVFGFWRGNGLNIIRTAPFKAVNFYAFDVYNKLLLSITGAEKNGTFERFTAGALAGITAVLSCLPLDTIRTRLLSSRTVHQYQGFGDCFQQIVRKEGVGALYKGCLPGILSIAPGSAVFYGVYGSLKQAHLNRQISTRNPEGHYTGGMELPISSSLLYGAIAGMCAEAVVYPLEVIKRQIQLQTTNGVRTTVAVCNNGVNSSILQACSTIFRTQGMGGFYAGVFLNSMQVLPSAALSYFTYEALKSIFQVQTTSSSKSTRLND